MNLLTVMSNNTKPYLAPHKERIGQAEWEKIISRGEVKPEKIKTKEALKLIGNGFCSEVKNCVSNIIKHPVPVLITSGVATGILSLLPFIGIPVPVGTALLTVGAASYSIIKTAKNVKSAIENNKQLKINKAKEDFLQAGKSSVGLACSLPFVPRSIKSIREFAKYGKIAVNGMLIQDLKTAKGLKAKMKTLKGSNDEFLRNYDYQKVAEQQISKLQLPQRDKDRIIKYVRQYNVPEEKLAKTVLEILKKENGLEGIDIGLVERQMAPRGAWSAQNATISMQDKKKPPLPSHPDKYQIDTSKPRRLSPDGKNYIYELVDEDGNRITKMISKKIIDDYAALDNVYENTSPQGQTISTMTHEFDHFLQDLKMARAGELDKTLSPRARQIFTDAVRRKGLIISKDPLNPEYAEVQRYVKAVHTPKTDVLSYLENEKEVASRMAQKKLFDTQEFQVLESVFKNLSPKRLVSLLKEFFISISQLNVGSFSNFKEKCKELV